MFLVFKKIGKGKTAVYEGRKRIATIELHGKFVRATHGRYMPSINAYLRSMR